MKKANLYNNNDFFNSFMFRTIQFEKYHHTDNRAGSPYHYFAYMITGNCKITTNTQSVNIQKGDTFFIPDGCSYQSYWQGNPKVKFISLGFKYLPSFDGRDYPPQVIKPNTDVSYIFNQLSHARNMSLQEIALFYTLSGMLLPTMKHQLPSPSQEIVDKTKDYLSRYPHAAVAEISKKLSISQATLYNAFKKSSPLTLNNTRNAILLDKAKNDLVTSDKSIEYISDILGFSSPSYFRKKFKSFYNITPKEMRRKHRI